jgi:NTP pyrophosphatase (non-canonical NTP hydrolase)
MMTNDLNSLAIRVHDIQVANGWWEDRRHITNECWNRGGDAYVKIAVLGLAMTELAEAIEAVRKNRYGMDKDSLERELGGAMVRILDMAGAYNLDVQKAFEIELEACKQRGIKHGGKAA